MLIKKRKSRRCAFSSIFRLQAGIFFQTRRAGSILPLTSLKGLENHKVSWSDTGFDFIKTALQTLMPHVFVRKTAYTFAKHAK